MAFNLKCCSECADFSDEESTLEVPPIETEEVTRRGRRNGDRGEVRRKAEETDSSEGSVVQRKTENTRRLSERRSMRVEEETRLPFPVHDQQPGTLENLDSSPGARRKLEELRMVKNTLHEPLLTSSPEETFSETWQSDTCDAMQQEPLQVKARPDIFRARRRRCVKVLLFVLLPFICLLVFFGRSMAVHDNSTAEVLKCWRAETVKDWQAAERVWAAAWKKMDPVFEHFVWEPAMRAQRRWDAITQKWAEEAMRKSRAERADEEPSRARRLAR